MKQTSKMLSVLTVMVIGFGLVPEVSAEKIFCADNINLNEFPICKYQTEWNISEKFNEKLIKALGERASELNAEPDRYREIYLQVYGIVDSENPGLEEQGEKLKKWIYQQLEEK